MAISINLETATWVHARVVAQAPFSEIHEVLGRRGYDEFQIRRIYDAALRDPDGFKAGFSRLSPSQPKVAHAAPKAPDSQAQRAQARAEVGAGARAGSSFVPVAPIALAAGHAITCEHGDVRVAFHSVRPYVVLFNNVLTHDECDQLIAEAKPALERAKVIDSERGGSKVDDRRTSELTVLMRGTTPLLARIDARITRITGVPVAQGEDLQVMRYGVGAEYTPHFDYFNLDRPGQALHLANGGQRISSLVIYLNDVEAGGETVFPEVGLSVAPAKGSAVYFAYTDAQSRCDPLSFHAGAPVLRGEKWIATRWMRERAFT
ncbi:2OG-Fe(II) oxygenase [Luteimonas sp. MC1572]|uniref:2OG-Fe(II) oxygenase n=1 Tax=Luteimonas sp. MC1572 TaxID=2799325 RepID=UPI0018F0D828|nr:2OG-Fe(II) oxygenase [Luteimonas sp. MC1572]MBJ6981349.1 2OG-Fe(II) oxygenase [Luteimonas sp. MC1572]QQO02663.1 2OG-Fe(II) oxygenase [Luteimonas sp. MC1572]